MVALEVLVHPQSLGCVALGLCQHRISWRENVAEEDGSLHCAQEAKRERGDQVPNTSFKGRIPATQLPYPMSTLTGTTPAQESIIYWALCQETDLWGTLRVQTKTVSHATELYIAIISLSD